MTIGAFCKWATPLSKQPISATVARPSSNVFTPGEPFCRRDDPRHSGRTTSMDGGTAKDYEECRNSLLAVWLQAEIIRKARCCYTRVKRGHPMPNEPRRERPSRPSTVAESYRRRILRALSVWASPFPEGRLMTSDTGNPG